MHAQICRHAVVVEQRVVDVEEEDDVHDACQASKTDGSSVECELVRSRGSSLGANQRSSETSSAATGSPATIRAVQTRFSVAFASGAVAVRLHPDPEEALGLDRQPRLLEELALEAGERVLVLLEVAAGMSQSPCSGGTARRPRSTRPSPSSTTAHAHGEEFA